MRLFWFIASLAIVVPAFGQLPPSACEGSVATKTACLFQSQTGTGIAWTIPGSQDSGACDLGAPSTESTVFTSGGLRTQILNLRGFSFSIPSSNSVKGIEVGITKFASATKFPLTDREIHLRLPGGLLSLADRSDMATPYSVIPTQKFYGNFTDLWGQASLFGADINSPDFGLGIAVQSLPGFGLGADPTALIEAVTISVCHSEQLPVPERCLTKDGVWRKDCNFEMGGFLKADTIESASFHKPPIVSFETDAKVWAADDTICELQPITINMGPVESVVECTGAGGTFESSFWLPIDYNGEPVTFEIAAVNTNPVNSGFVTYGITCACRSETDLINGVFSTLSTDSVIQISYSPNEEFVVKNGFTNDFDCDGPCIGGDHLFWRAAVVVTTFSDLLAIKVLALKLRFRLNGFGDR